MKTMTKGWRAAGLAVALMVTSPNLAAAITYDLKTDWSNISNPNGVWSLNKGTTALPFAPNWSPGQDAWADATFPNTGHVPVLLKAEQTFITQFSLDLQVGDIAMHGRCCSDLNSVDEANVTWTSDLNGVATISGATWWGGFVGRNVDWSIYINNALVTGGNIGDGDAFDRTNPFDFATGSGAAGVLTFNTMVGDVVRFEATKGPGSPFDHFIGVDLTIDVTPSAIAEPGTLALFGLGLAGLGIARRRKAAA